MSDRNLLALTWALSGVVAVAVLAVGWYYDPIAAILLAVCVKLGLRCANQALELREVRNREARLATHAFAMQSGYHMSGGVS